MSIVLGADIGGSHITAALVNLETRQLIEGSGKRRLVNSKGSSDQILSDWVEVIQQVFDHYPDKEWKIGIAMPGPFDYQNGISLIEEQDKFKSLLRMNVKEELAERLNIDPQCIRFMNDAACFLQGEVFCGAGREYDHVLGLTLGTGLGSAICKEGVADDADLWHAPFKDGIAEDYLSTRWFTKRYQEISGNEIAGVRELVEDETGSPYRKQLFDEFGENLGLFLQPYIKLYQADAIVLGGNIANAMGLFIPSMQRVLFKDHSEIAISKSILNEDAALLGAASSWSNKERPVPAGLAVDIVK